MRFFLVSFFLVIINSTNAQIFVAFDATGNNDGTSWTDAFTDLQTAINSASSGDSLWVKAGMYKPVGTNRTASYRMKSGVSMLGGFAGSETKVSERDFVNNQTIISGNIGDEAVATDNLYNVFWIAGSYGAYCSNILLDGLIIEGGYGNGGSSSSGGWGGGIMFYEYASGTVQNCVIRNNTAESGGAIALRYNITVAFNNVVFEGNGGFYASTVYVSSGTASFANCIFNNNNPRDELLEVLGNVSIKNSTFFNNSSGEGLDFYTRNTGSLIVQNTIHDKGMSGNVLKTYSAHPTVLNPGQGNLMGDLKFIDESNPIGPDGLWFTADDGLQLTFDSPTRNTGNNSSLNSGQDTDIIGVRRINGGTVDMGAYEFDAIPLFDNQTISASTYLNSGDFVGMIEASDPDADPVSFETVNGASPYFSIDQNTGEISVNDISSLDNSQTHHIDVTVRVHDPISYTEAIVSIQLIPQNPPLINAQSFAIDENPTNALTVGTVIATAGDISPITYAIQTGNSSGTFVMDENSGLLSIADSTLIDYEKNASVSIVAAVSDGILTSTANITISINDVNETPMADDYKFFISQNASIGTSVGIASANDPENAILTYSIESGNSQGIFTIEPNSGNISLQNSGLLDYIGTPQHTLAIRASDGTNSTDYTTEIFIEAPVNPNITYVNIDAFGNNDGTSWYNGYTDLETAISNSTSGDTLWIKSGTYIPNTTSSTGSYRIKSGTALVGGFAGTEVNVNERDFVNNPTIVSGNIGDPNSDTDNLFHVFYFNGNITNFLIDGIIVRDGYADDYISGGYNWGGGMFFYGYPNSGKVLNCVIRNNYARSGGAVGFNYNCNVTFENVVFTENHGAWGEAVYVSSNNTVKFNNCVFYDNYGRDCLVETYGTTSFTNCSVYGNTGGGTDFYIRSGGNSSVKNTSFDRGASASVSFSNCLHPTSTLSGENNITGDVSYLDASNPIGADGLWFTADDGLQLTLESSARNVGSTEHVSNIETDILGNPRTIALKPDIGAYEFVCAPFFTFAENSLVQHMSAVGDSVTTILTDDFDSQLLTLSIEQGNTGNAFAINSSTGKITVKTSSAIDVTTNPLFKILIKVSDGTYYDTTSVHIAVKKLDAVVSLNSNSSAYAGIGQSLTAQTTPGGLNVEYTYNGNADLPISPGEYEVIATVNDAVYLGAETATLTITKAPLQATANNATKTYGEVNPEFDISYSGFVNGESEANITEPTITCLADEATAVGNIDIVLSGGSADNYSLTLTSGTLSIEKATYDMNSISFDNESYAYDGTEKAVVITGTLPTGVSVNYSNNKQTNAGSTNATASFIGNTNYNAIEAMSATLTITKVPLTATANNATKTYGELNPEFDISYSGFVNGESESDITEPTITCLADEATAVGNIDIVLSGGSADNYALTLFDGILTIEKANQQAPSAPTLANKTENSITLELVTGCEYAINGGAWQASAAFMGLTSNTQYSLKQRYAETGTHYVSDASVSLSVTTDMSTSITSKETERQILVYPNPAKDWLTISNTKAGSYLEIFDAVGNKIIQRKVENSRVTLNMSGYRSGVYFIHISGVIHKIIIE